MSQLSTSTQPLTERGQRTRTKLLAAAEEVFGTLGYDRASVSEITRRAGVAQGTFYVYFPDKKAAFVELVRELSRTLRRDLSEAVAAAGDRLEAERLGFAAFFRFVQRHRNLYRIIRQAEFVDEAAFREYYQTLAGGYAEGLRRAMDAGEIRVRDAETLAYCLMGMGDFLGMRWVLWEDRFPPPEVFDTLVGFLTAGLRGDTGAGDGPGMTV